MSKQRRVTVLAGTAALLFGAGASFGAGTASAEPLLGLCGGTVEGAPGTQVSVAGIGLLGVIPASGTEVLRAPAAPLVGSVCEVTVTAIEPVQEVAEPVLQPLRQAPIIEQIVPQAPPPAPARPEQEAAPEQSQQQQAGPGAAPAAPPAAPAAPVAPQRFGPFLPAGFTAEVPQGSSPMFGSAGFYDYGQLFSATPGLFTSQGGGDLFGYSPDFGILGAQEGTGAAQDIAAAGRAQALPVQGSDRVALPVLVAVLMLSAVSAALVRSWVHGAARS